MRRLLPFTLLVLFACDLSKYTQSPPPSPESCDPADAYLNEDRSPALSKTNLPAGANYIILSGVTLSSPVAHRLLQIDEAFHQRSGKHLTIVSGTRDPVRQARAMVRIIELGGSLIKLYSNREAAAEIQHSYDQARASKKKPDEIISAVQSTLEAQIQRGVYISAHLRAGAVDVRNTNMTDMEKKAFRAAIHEINGVTLLEEHRPPHFHLEIDRAPKAPARQP